MSARLVYMRLECKRALKRLPHMAAGAIVLLFLMGAVALLAGKALYGGQASGRIAVGVVLPEGDALAKQVMSMIGSLESVKSLCDFTYMDREESRSQLEQGKLYAVIEVPEDFVQDIMNGTNTPIAVLLPRGAGIESRIFRELTEAGAATLGSSQAGIYAGDELLRLYGLADSIPQLEADLNRIYLAYSLPRMDYFKEVRVKATGDVDTLVFYGISMSVFLLLLSTIPVSGFLLPHSRVMRQKLALAGVGKETVIGARILGLTLLFLVLGLSGSIAAVRFGLMEWQAATAAALLLVCAGTASVAVFLYQAAGSLLGGVMLLFLAASAMHFLAGGFLPLVFLPSGIRAAAPFIPSYILIEGVKMLVTAEWNPGTFGRLCALTAAGFAASLAVEVGRG